MHDTTPATAVVADRRPLERHLLAFLLQDEGFVVRAEAGTLGDLLLALQRETPDAVVLHEHLAHGHDHAVIEQLRWLAPEATIVVLTSDLEGTPATLRALADVTIADGVGLTGLGLALTRPRGSNVPVPTTPTGFSTGATPAPRNARRAWVERLQGAVAASIVALAVIALRGGGTIPGAGGGAEVLAAPVQDAEPLAPDRPAEDPAGAEGSAGERAVPLAVALRSAAVVAVSAEPATGPFETADVDPPPTETEPAPTETDPPPTETEPAPAETDPPPTETEPAPAETDPPPTDTDGSVVPARPGNGGGPPAEVRARLKPKVQEHLAQLPPRGGGPPDRPRPGLGERHVPTSVKRSSTDPGANGHGGPPPWAGGHRPGHGNANGRPPWAHGPRP